MYAGRYECLVLQLWRNVLKTLPFECRTALVPARPWTGKSSLLNTGQCLSDHLATLGVAYTGQSRRGCVHCDRDDRVYWGKSEPFTGVVAMLAHLRRVIVATVVVITVCFVLDLVGVAFK